MHSGRRIHLRCRRHEHGHIRRRHRRRRARLMHIRPKLIPTRRIHQACRRRRGHMMHLCLLTKPYLPRRPRTPPRVHPHPQLHHRLPIRRWRRKAWCPQRLLRRIPRKIHLFITIKRRSRILLKNRSIHLVQSWPSCHLIRSDMGKGVLV